MPDRTIKSARLELSQIEEHIKDMLQGFESSTGLEVVGVFVERTGTLKAVTEEMISRVRVSAEVKR